MKILVITLHYLNGVGGGVFASTAYTNAIYAIYGNTAEVSLLSPISVDSHVENISDGVRIIKSQDTRSFPTKLLDFCIGNNYKLYRIAKEEIATGKYDIVFFDNSRSSFRLISLAKKNGAKVITIHHNFEKEYVRDNNTNPILKSISIFWTKCCEKNAVRQSNLNLTLTPEDKNLLINQYSIRESTNNIYVTGVFQSKDFSLPNINKSITINNKFAITGSLDSIQTERSLIPWIESYYSILQKIFPQSMVIIAGKNPSQSLINICQDKKIVLIPNPENMDDIIQNCDYYICPTNLGGGLKLRVMDGFRNGLPVICHEVSARGYNEFINNKIMFTYSNKETFETACKEIKESTFNSTKIQELFYRNFSFDSGVKRLKDILSFNNLTDKK